MIKNNKRRKNKKNKKSISFLIFVACISLVGYFTYTIVSLNASIQQRMSQENALIQKIEDEKKKSLNLKRDIASIGTDEFVEKHARDVFGYVKENEKIFYDINNN